MKTQMRKTTKTMMTSLFIIMVIGLTSCSNAQKNNASPEASKSSTVAPSIDIFTAAFMGDVKSIHQHGKAGTDLNQHDKYGSTPLNIAIVFGKTDAALALINEGANINAKNADGSTPLHNAAFFCRPEIVKVLLENGADKTIKNSYGSTPLESVSGSFEEVKPIYDKLSKDLGSLGLKFDYTYLKTTRPEIAEMLR